MSRSDPGEWEPAAQHEKEAPALLPMTPRGLGLRWLISLFHSPSMTPSALAAVAPRAAVNTIERKRLRHIAHTGGHGGGSGGR
jgi:hypothetical protein